MALQDVKKGKKLEEKKTKESDPMKGRDRLKGVKKPRSLTP
mgnify:CR=1 FL=1